MTIVILTDCPPRLRGDLTKWLLEINTGVYVGNISPRVRDELWERICAHVKSGRATMVYRTNNEQRMDFRVHNTTWEPVDFDGLKLMRRPLSGTQTPSAAFLPDGFSKAAHQQKARRMAQHRRMEAAMDNVCIDVETTGLKPGQDQVIELAALRVESGVPKASFQKLIRVSLPIPEEVARLTEISDADLEEGCILSEAMQEFCAFIGEDMLISHNATFDQKFLMAACREVSLPPLRNHFTDTLALARRKLNGVSNYKLSTLASYFGIESEHPHRALSDCYTTHALFCKLNEK